MIPFFIAGIYAHNNYEKIYFQSKNKNFVLGFVLFIVGLYIGYINSSTPDIRVNVVGNPLILYAGALLSILGLLFLSRLISYKYVIWLGVNSLAIMCMHLKVRAVSYKILSYINIDTGIVYGVLASVIMILILIIPVILINKYLPVLVGATKK